MSFLGMLFPERCRKCHIRGTSLCSQCEAGLLLAPPLPKGTFGVYSYGERIVQDAIWELKYHARSELARTLAASAVPHITQYLADTVQPGRLERYVFVPIPEHVRKERRKGFNQAALLARWWAHAFPTSRTLPILRKIKETAPQARLGKAARMSNVTYSMEATGLDPSLIYIVVDDVVTTGSTFVEATRALCAKGARNICCIALAHGYKRGYKKGHR